MRSGSIKACIKCAERHIGCHGTCERYLEERKKLDEYNKAVRLEKSKPIWEYTSEQRLKKGRKSG